METEERRWMRRQLDAAIDDACRNCPDAEEALREIRCLAETPELQALAAISTPELALITAIGIFLRGERDCNDR